MKSDTNNGQITTVTGFERSQRQLYEICYGGNLPLSTRLINEIFVFHSPTDTALQFLCKLEFCFIFITAEKISEFTEVLGSIPT